MAKVLISAVKLYPNYIVIMADPKVGKTVACLALKDALLVDMQEGSLSYDGYKKEAHTIEDIKEICKYNKEHRDYKVIVIDTLKEFVEACIPGAIDKYKKTTAGSKFTGGAEDLLQLPYGAGTTFLEKEFMDLLYDVIKTSFDKVVFLAHPKSSSTIEDTVELTIKSMDTIGKIKNVITRLSDGIGLMTRTGSKAYISFVNTEGVQAGSRFDHLNSKKILITEKVDGQIIDHWDSIFPDLYGKTLKDLADADLLKKSSPVEKAKVSKSQDI